MSKAQWYREPINWTLSGKGYSEKNIQSVFIHLLGKQGLFDPKEIRHQVLFKQAHHHPNLNHLLHLLNLLHLLHLLHPLLPKNPNLNLKQKKTAKPKLSRREQIIQANTLRLTMEREKSDLRKISHHKSQRLVDTPRLETRLGHLMWMGYLLSRYLAKLEKIELYDMYLDISQFIKNIEEDPLDTRSMTTFRSEYGDVLKNSREYIESEITDPIVFQMTQMNDRMPPLSRFRKKFRLDPWQKEALMAVERRRSVLICAPTSSGKTVITTYLSLQEGTKIFVVPSESLVCKRLHL